MIKRGFVDIDEGQIHYRYIGDRKKSPTLIMLHPGPTSSHSLIPLINELGNDFWVIAPDLMGMGDSVRPGVDKPDIEYFADSIFRFADQLEIEMFFLWGSMTGAHCGIEMSLQRPKRIRKFYIEFLQIYDEKVQKLLESGHAPEIKFDYHGSQLNFLWHLARDQHLFFPWFLKDKEFARPNGLPSPKQLHEKTVELLKAAETYHFSLNAALEYETEKKIKSLTVPIVIPHSLEKYTNKFSTHQSFCVSPSTATKEQVLKAADQIKKHLKF
ncbi:MAG: hypothetical protein CMM18_03540 [Rhodospirillaceae bacterium]|nr:hypothetical protein [Rhodospirillaceae bacterium]